MAMDSLRTKNNQRIPYKSISRLPKVTETPVEAASSRTQELTSINRQTNSKTTSSLSFNIHPTNCESLNPPSWNQNDALLTRRPMPMFRSIPSSRHYSHDNSSVISYPFNLNDYPHSTPISNVKDRSSNYNDHHYPTQPCFKVPPPPPRNNEERKEPFALPSTSESHSFFRAQTNPCSSRMLSMQRTPTTYQLPPCQSSIDSSMGNGPHLSTPLQRWHSKVQESSLGISFSWRKNQSQISGPVLRYLERVEKLFCENSTNKDMAVEVLNSLWEQEVGDSQTSGSVYSYQSSSRNGSLWRSQRSESVRSDRSKGILSKLLSFGAKDTSTQNASNFICSVGSNSRPAKSHLVLPQKPANSRNVAVSVVSTSTVPAPQPSVSKVTTVPTPVTSSLQPSDRGESSKSTPVDTDLELNDSDEVVTTIKVVRKKSTRKVGKPTAIKKLLDKPENSEGESTLLESMSRRVVNETRSKNLRKRLDVELLDSPYEEKSLFSSQRRKVESTTVVKKTNQVTQSKRTLSAKGTTVTETSKTTTTASVVCVTRSGRASKPPELYEDLTAANQKQIHNKFEATFKIPADPPTKKPLSRKTTKSSKSAENSATSNQEPSATAKSKGKLQNDSTASSSASSVKENIPPEVTSRKYVKAKRSPVKPKGKTKVTKPKAKADVLKPEFKSATPALDFSALDNDLFIPEVSSAARKGGGKGRGLNAVGNQTPPLHYFIANIDPNLINSATPLQQTPDWHISLRSHSEVKRLQKRKADSKKPKAKPANKTQKKPKRPTKAVSEALKLVCDPKLSARKRQRLVTTYFESDNDSE